MIAPQMCNKRFTHNANTLERKSTRAFNSMLRINRTMNDNDAISFSIFSLLQFFFCRSFIPITKNDTYDNAVQIQNTLGTPLALPNVPAIHAIVATNKALISFCIQLLIGHTITKTSNSIHKNHNWLGLVQRM